MANCRARNLNAKDEKNRRKKKQMNIVDKCDFLYVFIIVVNI